MVSHLFLLLCLCLAPAEGRRSQSANPDDLELDGDKTYESIMELDAETYLSKLGSCGTASFEWEGKLMTAETSGFKQVLGKGTKDERAKLLDDGFRLDESTNVLVVYGALWYQLDAFQDDKGKRLSCVVADPELNKNDCSPKTPECFLEEEYYSKLMTLEEGIPVPLDDVAPTIANTIEELNALVARAKVVKAEGGKEVMWFGKGREGRGAAVELTSDHADKMIDLLKFLANDDDGVMRKIRIIAIRNTKPPTCAGFGDSTVKPSWGTVFPEGAIDFGSGKAAVVTPTGSQPVNVAYPVSVEKITPAELTDFITSMIAKYLTNIEKTMPSGMLNFCTGKQRAFATGTWEDPDLFVKLQNVLTELAKSSWCKAGLGGLTADVTEVRSKNCESTASFTHGEGFCVNKLNILLEAKYGAGSALNIVQNWFPISKNFAIMEMGSGSTQMGKLVRSATRTSQL